MTSNALIRQKVPFHLFEVNISDASENALVEISKKLGIGLSLQEMKCVKDHFAQKQRNPTDVEMQTIGQTWSEHCYHKTFKGKIKFCGRVIDGLFKSYISKPAKEIKPAWCFSVFEDNAGIVTFDKEHGIAIKVETHNHPSAVEPFGGAATGTGGVIRDILGVWADPIACTDVLGFGPLDLDYRKLPAGVKHPRYVYTGVVGGIGAYGNNMGIPTVNGAIYFDESYTGNVVVYCGCIGLLPLRAFRKNAKVGDIIVLAGGKTGRDGIHGVTFASAELTEKSEEVSRPSVQIANPIEEEKLKRALIEIRDLRLGSSTTDLGGGGLSSAVGETASKFNCGAVVDLDKVPLRNRDIAPWEIYVSESQERMLLTVALRNLKRVMAIFRKEDVEATAIGKLTSDNVLRIDFQNQEVASIDIPFLFNPPRLTKLARYEPCALEEPEIPEPDNPSATLLQLLSSPNIASKERVIRTYDHEVKGNTVLKPLQGLRAGPNDSAVLKPLDDSWKGIVVSCGMNPNYGKIDPYWMAASAVDEAVRNNIAVGGRRIALLDNFTWGNPERPERMGSLVKACEACYDFAVAYRTPFISGKDSLYNESPLGTVTPTLLITALGIIPDVRSVVSMDTKSPNDSIYVVGKTFKELGGSEYFRLKSLLGKTVPHVRKKEGRRIFEAMTKAIDSGLVAACHDLSEGGLAVAAAEMAFGGGFGIELDLQKVPYDGPRRDDFLLFSESNTRFLVEISERNKRRFESTMKGTCLKEVGKTTESSTLTIKGLKNEVVVNLPLTSLMVSWKGALSKEA